MEEQITETRIVERDLTAEPLPQVSESWIQAAYTPEPQRTPEQRNLMQLSEKLIEEVMAANTIVLGVPMHNFSVPTALKAWIDLIVRAGKTFSYGAGGAKGLVPSNKKVFAIVSRGGPFAPDSPMGAMDFQVPYLQKILGFIGLTDVTFIHADKQSLEPDTARQVVDKAIQHLTQIADGCTSHLASAA